MERRNCIDLFFVANLRTIIGRVIGRNINTYIYQILKKHFYNKKFNTYQEALKQSLEEGIIMQFKKKKQDTI